MSTLNLFNSVPKNDFMHFYDNNKLDGKKVTSALKYKKEDIAAAAKIPVSSIRYDDKMPEELKQRLNEWATALNLVAEFFNDGAKAILWFTIPNPLLGGIAPRDMIRVGRFKKLLQFIQSALRENLR